MAERPLSLKAHEVRAVLEGRMTQVRRLVRDQPPRATLRIDPACVCPIFPEATHHAVVPSGAPGHEACCWHIKCPFGRPGSGLWVQETWALNVVPALPQLRHTFYAATDADEAKAAGVKKWKPSTQMPRVRSRLNLEVVSVRVERLQGISEADAQAEGCTTLRVDPALAMGDDVSARTQFQHRWVETHGADSWAASPWVWVVEFKRVEVSRGQ